MFDNIPGQVEYLNISKLSLPVMPSQMGTFLNGYN